MPDAFAENDVADPHDLQAAQQASTNPAVRAGDLLSANPKLKTDPTAAKAFLSQPNGDGTTVGQASKFVDAYGGASKGIADAAQSPHPAARSFWSNAFHSVANQWDGLRHTTASIYDTVGGQPGGATATEQRDTEPLSERSAGLVAGGKALGGVAKNVGEGLANVAAPTLTAGHLSDQGGQWKWASSQGQANEDLENAWAHLGDNVATAVNPFNKGSVWWQMAHSMAFFESMQKRKGTAYTEEYALPYILAALVTHSALVGGGAEEAELASTDEAATTDDAADKPRSAAFRGASHVSNFVTKPLTAAVQVAHTLGAPLSDLRLNIMYQLLNASQQDPELKKLWTQTADGVPVDEHGQKTLGNVGSVIAGYLGLPQGGFAKAVADPIDIYANYLGADPLGAAGKLIGATRTFDSVGGLVGHFFSGMGIKDGEDVYRTADQYRRVNRAFQWMAEHTASQINDTFRGLFLGDAGRTVLGQLGRATTVEEVQKIWADMAKGVGYVHNVAPSLSMYELTKASFKYGDATMRVGDSLAGTQDELHAEASAIEKDTGFKVWPPDSANYALASGEVGARVRERSLLGDFFAKLFTRKSMYFNEATEKMENFEMHVGSAGLSAAVADQLRALGESETTIALVGDQLLHASQDQINNFILNAYQDTLTKLTYANAKYSILDSVKVQLQKDLAEELQRQLGADGAGEKGQMINGPLGQDYSTVVVNGIEKNAGIGETHLGVLHFPRTRDLQGYAKYVAKIADEMTKAQDGMRGVDLHLSPDALEAKAAFADSNLKGLPGRLDEKVTSLTDPTMRDAFNTKMREIAQETRSALSGVDDTIGHNRAFVAMFERLRQNLDLVQRTLELVDEWTFNSRLFGRLNPHEVQVQLEELNAQLPEGMFTSVAEATPEATNRLRGELSALQEATAEFTARLQKNALTVEDLKSHLDPAMSDELRERTAEKIQDLRERNPRYRNPWQHAIDGVNYYYSKVFVPLALYSGGWAIRVGNSEMLLNTFREGGLKMFQDKLLTSYVKHETGRAVFTSRLEGVLERHSASQMWKGSFGDMLKNPHLSYAQKLIGSTVRTAGGLILQMRDLAGGTLHGLEGNLINWTPRTERMFDRVVGAIEEYAPGGLPMGVHSGGGIVADDAMNAHLLYGDDDGGKQIISSIAKNRTFAGVNPGTRNYYRGLRGSLTRIHDDAFLAPAMRTLQEAVTGRDLSKPFTLAEVNELQDRMTQSALTHLEAAKPSSLARFDRHLSKGKMALPDSEVFATLSRPEQLRVTALSPEGQQQFYAHYDMARTIAYHDLHTVMGTLGNDKYLIHASLLHQAVTGEVKPVADLRKEIDALPLHSEPRNIVAETHTEREAGAIATLANMPQRISDAGFRAVLGPMVNAYVRDPVYLSILDDEMEKLQPMVDRHFIDEESQKLRAHQNSVVKMSKYVHNPMDKTVVESNMRAFAPFYFAQNQAWRRALRMASSDPGAFEKYLKASLAFTDFISIQGKNDTAPVYIPGTEFMGALGGMGSGLDKNQLGSLGFSLAASVGSVSSVIPTGSEAGLGVLENIARPSWGPLVTLPLKSAEYFLGLAHKQFADKWIAGLIGPVAQNTSTEDEVLPSTFLRNILTTAEGAMNISLPSGPFSDSSFASAVMYVENNAIDNKASDFYVKNKALALQAGFTGQKAESVARALTDRQVAEFFNVKTNARQVQAFLDQVHLAATYLYGVKTMLGFGSPLSLSFNDSFSKEPQLQALLNEKLPDGKPTYTYEQAATLFAEKYPNHIYDLVAHSQSASADYPETTSALRLLEQYPTVVNQYPNAAAYLINRNSAYSPSAYQLEMTMRLRSRYNLSDTQAGGQYFDSLLIANGNDYYYNWLVPHYPDQGNSEQAYTNYKDLTAAAKSYGRGLNPTWFGYHETGQFSLEQSALNQMNQMVADPNIPDAVFGGNRGILKTLIEKYHQVNDAYQTAVTATQADNIEQTWYSEMTNLAAAKDDNGNLMFPTISYFMTSVLRNLPTRQP